MVMVTFTPAAAVGVGDQPFSVAVGFFNADTIPDLAVANTNSNTVSILLGDGDGNFYSSNTSNTWTYRK